MTDLEPEKMNDENLLWLYEEEPDDYEYYITADIYGNTPPSQTHLIDNFDKAIEVYTELYNNKHKRYVRLYKLGRKAIINWLSLQ